MSKRCSRCDGSGELICSTCGGKGYYFTSGDQIEDCSVCEGLGTRDCSTCNGIGANSFRFSDEAASAF